MKTKEALDRAAGRLKQGEDLGNVLDDLERDLPRGKVKTYLKETGLMIDDVLGKLEEAAKKYKEPEDAVSGLKGLQKPLTELQKKLNEAPEIMPEEITACLKAQIGAVTNIVDFIVMAGSVAETLSKVVAVSPIKLAGK